MHDGYLVFLGEVEDPAAAPPLDLVAEDGDLVPGVGQGEALPVDPARAPAGVRPQLAGRGAGAQEQPDAGRGERHAFQLGQLQRQGFNNFG